MWSGSSRIFQNSRVLTVSNNCSWLRDMNSTKFSQIPSRPPKEMPHCVHWSVFFLSTTESIQSNGSLHCIYNYEIGQQCQADSARSCRAHGRSN
jgi:hypothetical protein